jgi:hypothetical protein
MWKNGSAIASIYTARLSAVSRKSTLTVRPRIKSLKDLCRAAVVLRFGY